MTNQNGFTLVEVVVVIIILGIIAATALPRFMNVSSDARVSSLKAARGSIESALNMFHAKARVDGTHTQSIQVVIDGTTYWNHWGYPHVMNTPSDRLGIMHLAGLDTGQFDLIYEDVIPHTGTDRVKVSPKGVTDPNTCFVSVLQAVDANTPPVIEQDFSGC